MPHLSWNEVRDRAIRFSREHAGDRSESAEKQTFWNDFFNVFGLRRASLASFEENVRNLKGNKGAIDLLWKGKLLVEHKSFGEDLDLAQTQAFTYIEDLTRENRWDEIPRFVLVSDFANFVLYDLEPEEQRDLPLFDGRKIAPHHFTLSEFPRQIRAFAFMLGQTRVRLDPEDPANEKAYKRMCELHDALKFGGLSGHDLERLLVRILFCLFAEDTLIFQPEAFTQFIRSQTREDGSDLGARLNELFDWLNKPEADNSLEDSDPFYGFRYVNGGLFNERLGFPRFNRDMRKALLDCCEFLWAKISPAVFGSLFQGVMDDRARRQQGGHYTSERDIMKNIRSLFLDDLRAEFEQLKHDRSTRRRANLEAFHRKLRSLNFLDPACGCGNFLVLTYRELRRLEIEVLREIHGEDQRELNVRDLCKVDVDQFYGIELSEFPVRIAEVALWLMDHQINALAAEAFGQSFDRLPLRSSPHIVQGNALRTDWNVVLPREKCSYVLGNPPFIGAKFQNDDQRADMDAVAGDVENHGLLDYVTGWYFKAADYIQGTRIVVGFVSTNSLSQGEQAGTLWNHLFQHSRLKIHFAHRTFTWMSESRGKAHVHVVIIGFAAFDSTNKRIYDHEIVSAVGVEVTRLKSSARKNETP
ncbi:MAG: DNA methyltransferase, partial [Verrucomicrobiota bacterium]